MATLNTLRTKYGIVLSIVIAIVLLAFILGDQLSYRGGNQEIVDETVMTIDGKEIKASEYAQLYAYLTDLMRNSGASQDQIANMVSSTFVYDNFTAPALENTGLSVGASEVDAYAQRFGEMVASQMQQFGWPADQIAPMVRYQWEMESLTAEQTIAMEKFAAAAAAGAYVNRLEVERQMRDNNITFDGRYLMVPFSAAGEVEVSEAEIDEYYEQHKQENPSFDTRTIRYVSFNVEATDEDKAAIEQSMMEVDKAVTEAVGDTDAIKRAVRSIGGKADSYKLYSSIDAKVTEAIEANGKYGPELDGNTWKASYVISDVEAPASYDFEVAVFNNIVEAKEVVKELEANGGDFSKLANPVDVTTDSRAMVAMSDSEAEEFINCQVGDIFTYTYNHKPAVVKISALGEKEHFILTADVNKNIVASEDTRSAIASEVDKFTAAIGNTVDSFNEAANAAGHQVLVATANRNDYNPNYGMGRNVRGIANSRNMAVWAYNAEVGEAKNFHIGDVIYVAMIAAIDNNEFEIKNPAAIERIIKNNKQYEILASQLTMDATFEGAESGSFTGVKFADNMVDGKFVPALVGAIAATTETGVETKVKGANAAYVFVVDAINGEVDAEAIATERTPLNTQRESYMRQAAPSALLIKADIKDYRGEGEL